LRYERFEMFNNNVVSQYTKQNGFKPKNLENCTRHHSININIADINTYLLMKSFSCMLRFHQKNSIWIYHVVFVYLFCWISYHFIFYFVMITNFGPLKMVLIKATMKLSNVMDNHNVCTIYFNWQYLNFLVIIPWCTINWTEDNLQENTKMDFLRPVKQELENQMLDFANNMTMLEAENVKWTILLYITRIFLPS